MDPLADMLTVIRNASRAGLPSASFPFSNFKSAVADKLKRTGYLRSVTNKGKKVKKTIEVELLYGNGGPKIKELRRLSKPSCRVYRPIKAIHSVRQGYGSAFYSTSSGILTDKEAREAKIGGELLFRIW
ncbi:MAG: 30S ribosomal protein S8 [Patescibacteria group bacterium]|nr:30S ribosomal protein S8 [Patescibacteria group bacterium]